MRAITLYAAATVLLAAAVTGCVNDQPAEPSTVAIDHANCAREAEQLVNKASCYPQPDESGQDPIVLEAGSFVYRCGEYEGWTAIMYPGQGEHVDCHYRKDGQGCRTGWVSGTLMTQTFD